MASNLKARFEALGQAPPPTHSVEDVKIVTQEEIKKKTWAHSGNSVNISQIENDSISFFCALLTFFFVKQGGGHTGHDGKFAAGEKVVQEEKVEIVQKTVFAKRNYPLHC